MRKLLVVAFLVFAMTFALGTLGADQPQAKGGCWYTCDCNGVTLYCCRSGPIVNCKVVFNAPIGCTQQAGC